MSIFNGPTVKFEARTQESERGQVDYIADHVLFWPNTVQNHTVMGTAFTSLRSSLLFGTTNLAERAPDLSAQGFITEAKRWATDARAPFVAAQKAVRAARDASEATLRKPKVPVFAPDETPAVRADRRAWARGLKLSDLVPVAMADPSLAAAIVEGGQPMSGLPEDIFERIRDVMVRANLASYFMPATDFRTKPTADDPIADLPDEAALEAYVSAIIANHARDAEAVKAAPTILVDFIGAVATLTDQRREDAFALLTGAAA